MRILCRVLTSAFFLCLFSVTGASQQLFHKTYSFTQEDNPTGALPLPDGGILICGDVISQSPYSSHMFLTRLDSNGNALWVKYYFATQAHAVKVFPAADGGYYVSGYAYFAPNNWGFSLMKTDSAGNQEWTRLFAGSGPNDVQRRMEDLFMRAAYLQYLGQPSRSVRRTAWEFQNGIKSISVTRLATAPPLQRPTTAGIL